MGRVDGYRASHSADSHGGKRQIHHRIGRHPRHDFAQRGKRFRRHNTRRRCAVDLFLTLIIEFFVSSGSAKAFLLMPIMIPLADLVGVTRQTAVLAYVFGDGFSNLAYPTNPVLLICLGLTAVTYAKWIRWVMGLWLWVILASLGFLALAVAINYGPF
jgi:hypothetical protein